MKKYNANAIAKMLNVSKASFSAWVKKHYNELTKPEKYIRPEGKFIYYHPQIIKEIFEIKGLQVPKEIIDELKQLEIKNNLIAFQSVYNITDINDAIALIVKYKKENDKLRNQLNDARIKMETMQSDMETMAVMREHQNFKTNFLLTQIINIMERLGYDNIREELQRETDPKIYPDDRYDSILMDAQSPEE